MSKKIEIEVFEVGEKLPDNGAKVLCQKGNFRFQAKYVDDGSLKPHFLDHRGLIQWVEDKLVTHWCYFPDLN